MKPARTRCTVTYSMWALFALAINANAATLYVDANLKEDSTINRFASISRAIAKLQPGDTLLIARGTYRESLDLRQSQLTRSRPLSMPTRIAAAPGARPVIKGSDLVQGWQQVESDLYVKKPWSHNSQQVFINGIPLKQIGGTIYGDFPHNAKHPLASLHRSQGGIWPGRTGNGKADLVKESFYYDSEQQALYVRSAMDLSRGQTVEASTRPYLLIATGVEQIEVQGLRFTHANTTSVSQSGAITLIGNQLVLDGIEVEHVDGAGIDMSGNDNVVTRSITNYCGSVGLKVRGRRARIVDNESSFNNTRGFNKWWEAGGAKFVGDGGLQDSEVSGHRAYANRGDGLWFDWLNNNNRVHQNISAYNTGMGIHYEASSRGLIYDNYVFGNGQRGIYLPNSSNSVIAHNLVAANGMEGIVIVDERQDPTKKELAPTGNNVVANIVAWNAKSGLVLPLAAHDNRSDANIFVDANLPTFSSGWPSRERPIINGLDAWRANSGQDRDSRANRAAIQVELQQFMNARQPLSTSTRGAWDTLLTMTSGQSTPEVPGIDSEFSRPGSRPGPGASP